MSKLYIYEGTEGVKKYSEEFLFWSNSLGELHYHGEYDLKEEELPGSLRRAYDDLFADGTGSYCYLAEFRGDYGIALSNEFSSGYRKELGSNKAEYWNAIKKKAEMIRTKISFKDCSIIAVQQPLDVVDGEILVFMPWYIPKKNFDEIAKYLYLSIYKLDLPSDKLSDEEVLRIYDNLVPDSKIQEAFDQRLDIVACVEREITADDENESAGLLSFYRRGSNVVKAAVDATLIFLCGYDLENIITRAELQNKKNRNSVSDCS